MIRYFKTSPPSDSPTSGWSPALRLSVASQPVSSVVCVRGQRQKKRQVFRSVDRWGNVNGLDGRAVSRIVKQYTAAVGLDPARTIRATLCGPGSFRECDRRGITSSAVRIVTGHQSDAMLNVYTRPRSLFESSAGAFFDD